VASPQLHRKFYVDHLCLRYTPLIVIGQPAVDACFCSKPDGKAICYPILSSPKGMCTDRRERGDCWMILSSELAVMVDRPQV